MSFRLIRFGKPWRPDRFNKQTASASRLLQWPGRQRIQAGKGSQIACKSRMGIRPDCFGNQIASTARSPKDPGWERQPDRLQFQDGHATRLLRQPDCFNGQIVKGSRLGKAARSLAIPGWACGFQVFPGSSAILDTISRLGNSRLVQNHVEKYRLLLNPD